MHALKSIGRVKVLPFSLIRSEKSPRSAPSYVLGSIIGTVACCYNADPDA